MLPDSDPYVDIVDVHLKYLPSHELETPGLKMEIRNHAFRHSILRYHLVLKICRLTDADNDADRADPANNWVGRLGGKPLKDSLTIAKLHTMANDPVAFYGFTAVPRDPDVLFKDHPTASGPNPKQDRFIAADFPLPDSELIRHVRQFIKGELNEQTYNHSHRVYVYGMFMLSATMWDDAESQMRLGTALARTHFPEWKYDNETYFLACLLHDIGTAERFLATTKMSFEFKGAIVARDLILTRGGPEDQADSVCDAIVRHQDIFVKGFAPIFSSSGPDG